MARKEFSKARRHVEVLGSSAELLSRLIDDVLDFSKIDAGKMQIEAADFDLRERLAPLVGLLRPRAIAKGISLVSNVADDVPRRIRGDAVRLLQILTNLIGNAIKFTSEGWVEIDVSCTDDQPPSLEIAIRDSGIGIPIEVQASIFEPFTQADSSTTRRFGGTGLGLAISKRILELMDGELELYSEEGRGTEFVIRLPLVAADSPTPRPSEPVPIAAAGRGRLLLADDNPINQMVAVAQLEDMGFEAIEWALRYFLLGAVIVFPIWLISRVMKFMGRSGSALDRNSHRSDI